MVALNLDTLKNIPKVDRLLEWPEIERMMANNPRPEVLKAVRRTLDHLREQLRNSNAEIQTDRTAIIASIHAELEQRNARSLQQVINATGVVVHTNLGRAPLAHVAETAIQAVSSGYCNLEYDLENGIRGRRNSHVEGLICELTGAEAALVVNNNAAAVMLALSSLAINREVIISRGELVEIGGSFRIPDVMRQSGATLVEVGTTNRTHNRDFQSAITDNTALLLKVHTSNFAVVGFTAETSISDMARIGSKQGIPVMLDAGSGCLVDLTSYGIGGEPTIRRYLEDGADVVTFSGDKLLGGPQAGIIAGKKHLVEPMKQHPLLRAFRMDKLSLTALEATLRLYRDERRALQEIPVLRMLTISVPELSRKADMIKRSLKRSLPSAVTLTKRQGESSAGGGSFPLLQLTTTLLEVTIAGAAPQRIEAALRQASTPVIGRINKGSFLLDVRTVMVEDIPALAKSLAEATAVLTAEHP